MKTVILDMYGVIIKEEKGNFKNFLAARKPEADYGFYLSHYRDASLGKLKSEDFMLLFGFEDAQAANAYYVANFLTFDTEFIPFAEKCCDAGIRLALLSNDIPECSKAIQNCYGIEKYFDSCVISGDIGVRKPDADIYLLVLEKLNAEASDCVFIDDNAENLKAAEKAGFETLLFRRGCAGAVGTFGELWEAINPQIVSISAADLEECLDVIHSGFATVAEEFGLTEQNVATNGAFMKMERLKSEFDGGNLMYALRVYGKAVGFCQLRQKSDEIYELGKLSVLPTYRHNGYGGMLIEHAKQKVRSLGGHKITLGIIEENTRLKNWYISNGFAHTGTAVFAHLPFTVGYMECNITERN